MNYRCREYGTYYIYQYVIWYGYVNIVCTPLFLFLFLFLYVRAYLDDDKYYIYSYALGQSQWVLRGVI